MDFWDGSVTWSSTSIASSFGAFQCGHELQKTIGVHNSLQLHFRLNTGDSTFFSFLLFFAAGGGLIAEEDSARWTAPVEFRWVGDEAGV